MRTAEAALAEADAEFPAIDLHAVALSRYAAAVSDLGNELSDNSPSRVAAVEILRELVTAVVLTPAPDHWDVVVEGCLAALINPDWGELLVPQMRPGHSPTILLSS